MDNRQKQQIEAFRRVKRFIDSHPLPAPASYGTAQQALNEAVARLAEHTIGQMESARRARAGIARQRALKRALRLKHLRPIARIARLAALELPGLDAVLRDPRPNLPVTRLLADAEAVRNGVAPHAAVFVANSLPEDFLEQLDAAIMALEESKAATFEQVTMRRGARGKIAEVLRQARTAVGALDAIVTKWFGDDAGIMTTWRAAKRVQGLPASGSIGAGDSEPPLQAA